MPNFKCENDSQSSSKEEQKSKNKKVKNPKKNSGLRKKKFKVEKNIDE